MRWARPRLRLHPLGRGALVVTLLLPGVALARGAEAPASPARATASCANPQLPAEILGGPPAVRSTRRPLEVRDYPIAGSSRRLELAVAGDAASRETGLMCVLRLKPAAGMVFVFDHADSWQFWMKNTLVPLDMLWVDTDGRVTSVAPRVPASTLKTPDDKVARRAGYGRYVVELASGEAQRLSLSAGSHIAICGNGPGTFERDERLRCPPAERSTGPGANGNDAAVPPPSPLPADSPAPSAPPAALGADDILARARAAFRAHPRPPYVAYTIARRDLNNGLPDFEYTYTERVWYRSADGAAMVRRMWRGDSYGALRFVRPIFNGPVDPGPPTADLFEAAPLARTAAAAHEADAGAPPTIGTISIAGEFDYRARLAEASGGTYHLLLEARRDPQRNRLRELWVDARTFETQRLVANDRLFIVPSMREYPQIFELQMGEAGGVPVIARIRARTLPRPFDEAPDLTSDYRFSDVSFPPALPDWYFRPETYRAHLAEAPQR